MEFNNSFKKINGNKLSYKDIGNGSVIFCLPPFPSSSTSFIPFINKVKKQFRVIALDLPGFGGYSSLPNKDFTLDQYIEIIEKFIQSFKLKNYFLLGYSFGGTLALNIVKRKIVIPKKLILVSAFYQGEDLFKQRAYLKRLKFLKNIPAKSFFNNLYTWFLEYSIKITSFKDYIKIKNDPFVKQLFKEFKNMSVSTSYRLIEQLKDFNIDNVFQDIPTLIIYSEHDILFIKKQMEDLSKNLRIKSYFVKDADHRHFYFKVEKSADQIINFLKFKAGHP